MTRPLEPRPSATEALGRVDDRLWLLGILVLAVAVRLHGLTADGLWYDELLSTTRAYPSFRTAILSKWTAANHPPAYEAQLYFWLRLGTSDLWARLNPWLWNVASLVSLYYVGRRLTSGRVALLATLFLALSAFHVYFAQEVRMYSLMIFLSIWVWFFTHQFFTGRSHAWAWGGLAVLATLLQLYSHGAGFLILISSNTLAAWYILAGRGRSRAWLWMALQATTVLLYVPWLLLARERGVEHTLVPTLQDVVRTLYYMLVGFAEPPAPLGWPMWVPVVILAVALTLVLAFRRGARPVTVAFVLMPLVSCFAISYWVKPIWLFRTLAYIIPFICLTLALACTPEARAGERAGRPAPRLALAVCTALMLAAGLVFQKVSYRKPWTPRQAAQFVSREARPGETVQVPNQRLFWVWCWYFVGPGSIDPLAPAAELSSPQGVRTLTGTTFPEPGTVTWLVYRTPEELGALEPLLQNSAPAAGWTFGGIRVARVVAP